ncbi:MAG: malate synthase A [Acidimicrobiales bacterium]
MTVEIASHPQRVEVLTDAAVRFLVELERRFGPTRRALLAARQTRQARLDDGELPDFLPETAAVRADDWLVAPAPADLQDRRVEITGPVERKMMINALNSGARVFMADFEDSNSPTWDNVVQGQINVRDAYRRELALDAPDGKRYRLDENIATLVIRPRGWHLPEKHVVFDGAPMSASLFDAGLVLFHNARAALDRGTGPYFYLPKLESHLEARLWNDVFCFAQDELGVPRGSVRATVLIETILAAFEMDEILYELREHSAGLNAGRWDYIFSVAKKLRNHPQFVLPDRVDVSMTTPFMRAYTELLVKTCHKRRAHAIGGMSAFIPNRRDPAVTEQALAKVRDDKRREATDGCDGTWVAHPDLVPVAMAEFDRVLGERPNQVDRQRPDVHVQAANLLDVESAGGSITEAGVRLNVDVGLRYIESWLAGTGAAAIHNLMEDAATAEISRAQLWQWIRHHRRATNGMPIDRATVAQLIDEGLVAIEAEKGTSFDVSRFADARKIFEHVALAAEFDDFLTLPAYELLD